MLNKNQLERLAAIVDLGQKITFMSRHPRLAEMADAAGAMLAAEFDGAFPDAIPSARAGRKERAAREQAALDAKAEKGRELWAEFHRHTLSNPGEGEQAEVNEARWIEEFRRRVHRELCPACAAEMRSYVNANPPDLAEFFGWGVRFHNYVNAKLGKPLMDEKKARKEWGAK